MRTRTIGLVVAGLVTAGALVLGIVGPSQAGAAANSEAAAKAQFGADVDKRNQKQLANAPKAAKPPQAQAQAQAKSAAGSSCTPVAWDQGLSAEHSAPMPGGIITISNAWHQTIGANHVSVYVGAAADDPHQGLVVVQTFTLCGLHSADQDYPAPAGIDKLTITSVTGHVLTMTDASGATVTFDVVARTFG